VLIAAAVLGVLTALALAWALAAWMPLAMYPRDTAYHFVAGGRPWGAARRHAWGVWNLWWDELNVASMAPPPTARSVVSKALDAMKGNKAAPEPKWPATPDGWVALAEEDLRSKKRADLGMVSGAPSWGTFANGGSALPGIQSGTDHGFGWPWPALWYRVNGASLANAEWAIGIEGGLMLSPPDSLEARAYSFRALPWWPAWPGLAGDASVFAGLWLAALAGPMAIRRMIRRRRGWCIACGYDRSATAEDSPCPECGTPAMLCYSAVASPTTPGSRSSVL